jgi:HNH endonuclease/AAA domain
MTKFGAQPRDRSRSTRNRRLRLYPFCAHCAERGIQRLTAIIDHRIPLSAGGPDTDENCQGLCALCEAIKTAGEQHGSQHVTNHPEGLRPSGIPVTIVCGPPCGGKSTYVARHAREGDLVIDLDAIADAIDPKWERRWNRALLNRALRVRNALLGSLAARRTGKAFFIVSAPTDAEQGWWLDRLGSRAVLVQCIPNEIDATIRALSRDGHPRAVPEWYAARRAPWQPESARRLAKVASDVDGYPVVRR